MRNCKFYHTLYAFYLCNTSKPTGFLSKIKLTLMLVNMPCVVLITSFKDMFG